MRKKKFTRLICLALACLFLVSTIAVAVSADQTGSVTDKSIEDYVDKLSTMSYKEYMAMYPTLFADPDTDFEPISFDATKGWTFELEGKKTLTLGDEDNPVVLYSGKWNAKVQMEGDQWTLQVVEPYLDANENIRETVHATYSSIEAAVEAGVVDEDSLAYLGSFGGRTAIYTPDIGSVTWTLDLASHGISETGLYQISIEYYSVSGKSAAAEREFYVNGEAPFSEARSLTLTKIWSSYQNNGTVLTARYTLGKKDVLSEVIAEADAAGFDFTVAEDGTYIDFQKPEIITSAKSALIQKYNLRFLVTDANNNELRPTMTQEPSWSTYTLRDSEGFYANDFGFVLTPDEDGTVKVSLEGVNEAIAISSITLKPYEESASYAEYYQALCAQLGKSEIQQGTGVVKIEAENTTHTSTNVVYPVEDRASAVTSPADTTRVMLNTIGGEKWATAGQWVEYSFEVDSAGMYDIYMRYKQSYLDGMYVCRSLQIFTDYKDDMEAYKAKYQNTAGYYNGVPFAEATELRYDYGTNWQVTNLVSGDDDTSYQIYFEKGVVYTVRFEVTLGSMSEQVQKIESILTNLNADYLSIIKLTGTSPDDYRDYNFSTLLPDVLTDMLKQAAKLREVSQFLKDTANVASTYSGTCDKLEQLLSKLAYYPDDIAKNLDNFKSYVGNLGTFLSDAKTQPLQLDYISVQPASEKAPVATANWWQSFIHECKCFFQSFVRDYNSMGAMEDGDATETIEVWLAYGRDQSQVIRNLATNEFTPESKISVDLKLVSGGTLLPSILAGMGPDVYLGLGDATVINYAIRGALTNIEDMEGFDAMVDECFTRASMLQLEIADADGVVHTYGLPETQSFQMMFVRLDILGDLGIEIPKTWDELFVAQSKLESNNMEIGVNTNYKIFLYQSNGDLYADDGMRINLDSVKGLAAFEKMCSMFTQHSFPYSYNAANRFRTGEMPIVLADYTGLYNQLKVFATEIDGDWTFVPVPGTVQEDGSINNTADSTINAVVMIAGLSETQQLAAWNFMKWYTGGETQSRYANEMVAIIGDSAKHPTANRTALKDMPWTREELDEVMKQFENLAAIPNYPGSYYLDRHTNFAFLAAYNDDADPSTELLSYINTINNEITRKRKEFNLETLQIGQTLASKRMDQALTAMELLQKLDGTKYNVAIEQAKYGIANEKIAQLREAAASFSDFLEYDFIDELIAIEENSSMSDVEKTTAEKKVIEQVKTYDFFKNVGKQTADGVKNGAYNIADLNEKQLVYFAAECLRNAADALASYN